VVILLLFQISQQLAAVSNNTQTLPLIKSPIELPSFAAPRSAVYTNVFWFLSLGLSLACALIATLIQQWASDYIHAIERRQLPEKRARIRAFLYEGVENSHVGAIVDGAPLLLHASLFSFLIGLVIFMQPINSTITTLLACILALCVVAYLASTVTPIIAIASPICTPLTMFLLKFSFASNLIRRVLLTIWELGRLAVRGMAQAMLWIWTGATTLSWQRISSLPTVQMPRLTFIPGGARRNPLAEITDPFYDAHLRAPRVDTSKRSLNNPIQQFQWALHHYLPRLFSIWTDPSVSISNLDFIREAAATDTELPGFQDREQTVISWTFESLSGDAELIPFLEGIPSFLNSDPSPHGAYNPIKIMKSSLRQHSEDIATRLLLLLDSPRENRGTAASIKAVMALLEHDIYLGDVHFGGDFLQKARLFCGDREYSWLELLMAASWSRFPVRVRSSAEPWWRPSVLNTIMESRHLAIPVTEGLFIPYYKDVGVAWWCRDGCEFCESGQVDQCPCSFLRSAEVLHLPLLA
jgi:hypothetical protein